MISLSPAVIGLLKGILIVAVAAICSYLENAANLTGIVNPLIATVIAALASSFESQLKANSNNTVALMGAVKVK